MSAWGCGIKQGEEFMDVYDEFFDSYIGNADAIEIYHSILNKYQQKFSDANSEVDLLAVYYALAQCLWECGVKDEWLWQKIKAIIDTDADLIFWNDAGGKPQFNKKRRSELKKFWEKLNSVPANIKKSKKTQRKRGPTLKKGDLYAYICENGYRVAITLDYIWSVYLTAISEKVFDHVPTEEEAMNSYTHTVAWFSEKAPLPKKDRIIIAELNITGNYNNRAGLLLLPSIAGCSSLGERKNFFDLDSAVACMQRNNIGRYRLCELLDTAVLPEYHSGINIG